MELIFLEYFFPRLIPHKVKIALSGRYYWKLLNALGQYGLSICNMLLQMVGKNVLCVTIDNGSEETVCY